MQIQYYIERHRRIHITSRGNKKLVTFNDHYAWTSPIDKPWQTKKYKRSDVELIEIPKPIN